MLENLVNLPRRRDRPLHNIAQRGELVPERGSFSGKRIGRARRLVVLRLEVLDLR